MAHLCVGAEFTASHTVAPRFIVGIPIHVNGQVVSFYDDDPPPLQTLSGTAVSYDTATHAPGHRLWLQLQSPASRVTI